MNLFNRAIRLFLFVTVAIVGLAAAIAAFMARLVLAPTRTTLWTTPDEVGLSYSDVQFPARHDGIRLSGWFIPADHQEGEKRPTVIMIHGWPWQRLGEEPVGPTAQLLRSSKVDLLRMAKSLRDAGYHVLMFDLRNHGESASAGSITFGQQEANDLLGAIDYVKSIPEVDDNRIGTLGFSMGGNTILYGLTHTDQLKAAIAVQPTSPAHFAKRLAHDMTGPLSKLVLPMTNWFIELGGGMRMRETDPLYAAPSAGQTPVLFVQGAGDKWGSVENVTEIAAATPNTIDLIIAAEATDRYSGYQYIIDNPHIAISFFDDYLV